MEWGVKAVEEDQVSIYNPPRSTLTRTQVAPVVPVTAGEGSHMTSSHLNRTVSTLETDSDGNSYSSTTTYTNPGGSSGPTGISGDTGSTGHVTYVRTF